MITSFQILFIYQKKQWIYLITVFNLFSVYECFELLCYDDFKNNIVNNYKEFIPEYKILKLN